MAQLESGRIRELFTSNINLFEQSLYELANQRNVSGVSLAGLDHDFGITYFFFVFTQTSGLLFNYLKPTPSEDFPRVEKLLSRKDIRRGLTELLKG